MAVDMFLDIAGEIKGESQDDKHKGEIDVLAPLLAPVAEEPKGILAWLDRTLDRIG